MVRGAMESFKRISSQGRAFKFEWRHVIQTMDWPSMLGADVAPGTATARDRPEGEQTFRKRRRDHGQTAGDMEDSKSQRFVRLSLYAEHPAASPETAARAKEAMKRPNPGGFGVNRGYPGRGRPRSFEQI